MNFTELLKEKIKKIETVPDLNEIVVLLYLIWKPHPSVCNIDIENVFDENGHLSEQTKRLPP